MVLLSALLSVFAFSVQAASPPPVADGRTDMLTTAHSMSNVTQPVVITEYYTYQYDNAALQPVKPPTPGNLYTTDTVSYCGNVVFGGDSIRYILVDGGYVTSPLTAPEYHFYLRDHLGSNRVVCSSTGAVEQKNHSYPYGMPMDASTSASSQPYKYNGKELVRSAGLNWLDYGARWHDPILGRWHSMDSRCEDYYSISPYVYCLDNPINHFDPDGNRPGDFFKSIKQAAIDFGLTYNDNSIRENKEYASVFYFVINENNEIGFSYNIPNIGTERGVLMPPAPSGYLPAAKIHTHAAFSPLYRNNEFSGIYIEGTDTKLSPEQIVQRLANDDTGNANREQMDSFIVTPNGSLQRYDFRTGKISIISKDMPSDPEDPTRMNNIPSIEENNPLNNYDYLEINRRIMYNIFK